MTKHYCDRCKSDTDLFLLTETNNWPRSDIFAYMGKKGLQQGLFQNIELCPDCLQEFNWLVSAFYRREIQVKNPFKDNHD